MEKHIRRKKRHTLKGRQLDPSILETVNGYLKHLPQENHYLLEHLHTLNDQVGALKKSHLQGLARWLNLSMSEVYEVASFYSHFTIIEDNETPPKVHVRVCNSLTCHLQHSEEHLQTLKEHWQNNSKVAVSTAPCLGLCDHAVATHVNQKAFTKEHTLEDINQAINKELDNS